MRAIVWNGELQVRDDVELRAPEPHEVKVGDHVVLTTLGNCGQCDACDRGQPTHCRETFGKLPRPFTVGFAAETEELERHAREKLENKRLDLMAANWVGQGRGFDRDDNALTVFWRDGAADLGQAPKLELARRLIRFVAERYSKKP